MFHQFPYYHCINICENVKAKTKLHDLKVAVGYPNETQSFFKIRDRSVIVISKKDYPILYCSFLA